MDSSSIGYAVNQRYFIYINIQERFCWSRGEEDKKKERKRIAQKENKFLQQRKISKKKINGWIFTWSL